MINMNNNNAPKETLLFSSRPFARTHPHAFVLFLRATTFSDRALELPRQYNTIGLYFAAIVK